MNGMKKAFFICAIVLIVAGIAYATNSVTGPKWKLDTVGTVKESTETIIITKLIFKPTAAAQTCTITDGYGQEIWTDTSLAAAPAGTITENFENLRCAGLILSVLGGGTLDVYRK